MELFDDMIGAPYEFGMGDRSKVLLLYHRINTEGYVYSLRMILIIKAEASFLEASALSFWGLEVVDGYLLIVHSFLFFVIFIASVIVSAVRRVSISAQTRLLI